MSNDWDLSAIVRSYSSSAAHKAIIRNTNALEESFFSPDQFPFHLSPSPDFSVLIPLRNELDDPFDELSRVYKPFYPRFTTAAATPVAADSVIGGSENKCRRLLRKEVQQRTNAASPFADATAILINAGGNKKSGVRSQGQVLRGRRRKERRLVMKKKAKSLYEDEWNWRKYGQKPIFGSMNPRSYYRCTSFKGCRARKQVEKCEDELGMFIVTYIGDHTHRRVGGEGSEAGTTGNGSASPTSDDTPKQEDDDDFVMAMHRRLPATNLSLHRNPSAPPGDLLRSLSNARKSH